MNWQHLGSNFGVSRGHSQTNKKSDNSAACGSTVLFLIKHSYPYSHFDNKQKGKQ